MARYRAIKRGFDGVKSREVDEEFEFSGKPGKWMQLVDEKPQPKAPAPKAESPKGGKAKEEKPSEPSAPPTGDQQVI